MASGGRTQAFGARSRWAGRFLRWLQGGRRPEAPNTQTDTVCEHCAVWTVAAGTTPSSATVYLP